MKILPILFLYFLILPNGFSQIPFSFEISKDQIEVKSQEYEISNLKVFLGKLSLDEAIKTTPILSEIDIEKHYAQFYPFVPFSYQQDYTIIVNQNIHHFQIPLPETYNFLQVENVFPHLDTLPANILKFYIQFSKPINETNIYDYIYFLNAENDTIYRATLNLENPLISEDERLLTVWIEPGRQKRDLGPNQKLGSVFEVGQSYSILISKSIKDKNGVEMSNIWQHHFHTKAADRTKLDIETFQMEFPEIGTKNPIKVHIREPLDYGSALDGITILNTQQTSVKGTWHFENHQSTLIFTPDKAWTKGTYEIQLKSWIEDLAGNNLIRLFDNPTSNKSEKKKTFKVRFIIKP